MNMKDLRNYIEEHGPEHFKNLMIEKAAKLIKKSGHVVVLTGAGISTESGIPDYRSHSGLWDGHKPEEISHWSKIGTPEFLKFMSERIRDFEEHEPNIAHEILAKWQKNQKVTIITQNIESYHQKAGATGVIEMHGHMRYLECTECLTQYDNSMYTKFQDDDCEICDGILRPPVILFGENLPALPWHQALTAAHTADLVLVLGTSLQVAPFNTLIDEARNSGNDGNGARVIIITKSDTPYDGVASVRINESVGDTLKSIDDYLTNPPL